MARPTARVLALLELLQSGGLRSVAELADRLGVDERTVRRYVEHLVDLDLPVESVRGRYGGYRLARGHRLPPLMFTEDEALTVMLSLLGGGRSGLPSGLRTARETAAAKVRRVLPERLAARVDAVLATVSVTGGPAGTPTADPAVLLGVADAISRRQPVRFRYTDRAGALTDRRVEPYGLVAHQDRWYVTGADLDAGAERTFRLDRIAEVRTLPGSFVPPADRDEAERLITHFATAAYQHVVRLRIHAAPAYVRSRVPATVGILTDIPSEGTSTASAASSEQSDAEERWLRLELHAESLDWVPGLLATLDRPFVIETPDELRSLVARLGDRLRQGADTQS